jgi:hypothetical protein
MRKLFAALLCELFLLLSAIHPALALDQGKIEGNLAYKGKRVKLEHVLVVRHGNEEGLAEGEHLRVFFSDREIPLGLTNTASLFSLRQALHATGASAVVLKADPRGKIMKAQVELLSATDLPWPMQETASVPVPFTRLALGDRRLSGAASLRFGELEIAADFDAPVMENPVTAQFHDKAARTAAPARALIACTTASRNKDMDALGKCFSDFDRKEVERLLANSSAKEKKSRPTTAQVAKSIQRVVVRGNNATVVMDGDFVEMVLEGGVWKIKG